MTVSVGLHRGSGSSTQTAPGGSQAIRIRSESFSRYDKSRQLDCGCETLSEQSLRRSYSGRCHRRRRKTTCVNVTNVFVDKGYRGHKYTGTATIHLAGSSSRNLSRVVKRRRKGRSAVEPKIGHLKADHRMQRCFLKGLSGDAINATLAAAAGSNLLKLLRALIFWLQYAFSAARMDKNDRLRTAFVL